MVALLRNGKGACLSRRTWHSTKWPIRALAMTGMVTVSMISLIILGSLMRATPPWDRMSAGTRSRAMTADAPASSAIRACGKMSVSDWPCYSTLDVGMRKTYLLSVDNVHDDSALQHACQTGLDGKVVLTILCAVTVCGGEFSCHCEVSCARIRITRMDVGGSRGKV
jgi:hypothetical protein